MAQGTYTDNTTDRTAYARDEHPIAKMVLPLLVGLVIGFGAGKLTDNDNNVNNMSSPEPTMGTPSGSGSTFGTTPGGSTLPTSPTSPTTESTPSTGSTP